MGLVISLLLLRILRQRIGVIINSSVILADCFGLGDSSIGEFFCPSCQEQRFGGTKDRRRSMGKRRSNGAAKTLLTKDRVSGRCTRLLQVPPEATTIGGCVFCK